MLQESKEQLCLALPLPPPSVENNCVIKGDKPDQLETNSVNFVKTPQIDSKATMAILFTNLFINTLAW